MFVDGSQKGSYFLEVRYRLNYNRLKTTLGKYVNRSLYFDELIFQINPIKLIYSLDLENLTGNCLY